MTVVNTFTIVEGPLARTDERNGNAVGKRLSRGMTTPPPDELVLRADTQSPTTEQRRERTSGGGTPPNLQEGPR